MRGEGKKGRRKGARNQAGGSNKISESLFNLKRSQPIAEDIQNKIQSSGVCQEQKWGFALTNQAAVYFQ